MAESMSFEEWWKKIKSEWAFPSEILNNKVLYSFLKMIAQAAYNEGRYHA